MNRKERRKAVKCKHPKGVDWCSDCFGLMWNIPTLHNSGRNTFELGFIKTNHPRDYPKPDYQLIGKPIPINHELYENNSR